MEIPAGAVVEGRATFAQTGMIDVLYEGRTVTVVVRDLLDSAGLDTSQQD